MFRYEVIGSGVISVDLKNGYTVIVLTKWDKENNVYNATLYLKGCTYDTLDLIEEKENIIIDADRKTLFVTLLKMISELSHNGFLEKYIHRYEYMMKCFDKGNEFFELERIGKNHADK